MSFMKKTIFIPDRWVKFKFNNEICVGVTFLQDSIDVENYYQLVFFITNNLTSDTIEFSDCIDLRYLEFVKKPEHLKSLKINNEFISLESQVDLLLHPDNFRNTITVLANNQCKYLFLN